MVKIGIIGDLAYNSHLQVITLFDKIKKKYGSDVTILSGGNDRGVEPIVKKLALELELKYAEYNPSYTGKRMYSAMPEDYYGKQYHLSHLTDRYRHLIYECSYLIIFINKGSQLSFELDFAIKCAEKSKKVIKILS